MLNLEQQQVVSTPLSLTGLLTWPANAVCGRQGDVVIVKLGDDDPLMDSALHMSMTKKLDRVLAKGSRAAHTAEGATVYELPNNELLIVASAEWVLYHHDEVGSRHHPHMLPAGCYKSWQQQEETPQGVRPVQD